MPDVRLLHGDCLDVLPGLAEASCDALVTDPPYHLTSPASMRRSCFPGRYAGTAGASRGFMGKEWDGGDIAFRPETWAAVLRVIRPGGYGLVFGAEPYIVTSSSTAPQVSATYPVTKVDVKVGDTVKKGQTVATADTADLRRQLTSARNSLTSAHVNLNAANDTLTTANSGTNTAAIRQAKIGQLNAKNQVATADTPSATAATPTAVRLRCRTPSPSSLNQSASRA